MKLTIVLAITLATVASLCTASPLVLAKALVQELVHKHMNPPETETVVVYTPVQPYQQVLPAHEVSHHHHHEHHNLLQSFAHGKMLPELGALLKHPLLQKLPLLNLLPWRTPGGVEEVHHEAPTVTSAPYPPPAVHELPHEPVPELVVPEPAVPVPDCEVTPVPVAPVVPVYPAPVAPVVPEYPAPVAPVVPVYPAPVAPVVPEPPAPVAPVVPEYPAPVVPAPVYGVPAPVYGVPAPVYGPPTPTGSEFSSASSSSTSSASASSDAKYVAVNPGARHEATLPGHSESVLLENLQPAPGTEGQVQLLPQVVQSDLRNVFNPTVLDASNQLPSEYIRSAATPDVWTVMNGGTEAEPRYIAINGDLRHEAPLPGYDHSIVIENTDKV